MYRQAGFCYNNNHHGGESVSTGKAESVMQAEAAILVKMAKALTANNNQTAYAFAA